MPELIIGAVLVIAISVLFILNNKQTQKTKEDAINILKSYGTITSKDGKIWFEKNQETYEIYFTRFKTS